MPTSVSRAPTLTACRAAVATLTVAFALSTPSAAQVDWTPLSAQAPRLSEPGYAWDAGRGRLVVFGGWNGSTRVDETWEWDGGPNWTRRMTGVQPSPRTRAALCYDAARNVIVLFGGFDVAGNFLNDTWTWNGVAWQQRPTPVATPSVRFAAAMAFDVARGEVVLFGGFDPSGQDNGETWIWNGSTWSQRTVVPRPANRGAHRMAYDAVREEVVLFGGYSTPFTRTVDDTWVWDGSTWSLRNPTNKPERLCDQILEWDVRRERVVLFGGLRIDNATTQITQDATWDWDGADWIRRAPTSTTPSPRANAIGGYDLGGGHVLLAGGADGPNFVTDCFSLTTANAAELTNYGVGCANGTGGAVPTLSSARSLPWLDDTFELALTNAPPTTAQAFVLIGLSDTMFGAFPLPLSLAAFGAPTGCDLLAAGDASAPLALSGGRGRWTGRLCDCPSIVGRAFYCQAVVPDLAAPTPLAVVVSNGVRGVVGAR